MAFVLGKDIDPASARLIIELQLEDAERYFASSKGKSREPTSEEQAFQMQNEELKAVSQTLLDRRMAESVAAAVRADGQILANCIAQEETAIRDRDIACRWTGGQFPVAKETPRLSQNESELDDENLEKLEILYMSGLQGSFDTNTLEPVSEELEGGESSVWAAQRAPQRVLPTRGCISCREETNFANVVRVPCHHEYCHSCIEDLFKASMTDETLFPPKCCRQPISMDIARIFLKPEIVQQYEKKKLEFETPNKTYCYNPECAIFIPTAHVVGETATCPECDSITCTSCKARAHTGDCLNDPATQQLLAVAQENGWQRCHTCWRMVELEMGCNHITCRCGAQFCYICGERWKTCACERWNEHRLLARAHQIVGREQNRSAAAIARRDEPRAVTGNPESADRTQQTIELSLAATVQYLREHHECDHERWRYINGAHECEECWHRLPQYIFECRQCKIRACNQCRRNRL